MKRAILLVDDEPNLLHSLCRAFRKQPYDVYTARSAEEAMEVMKAHPVDLVVSDENMPGMSGTKFLTWVAENFPQAIRIILTGQPDIPTAMRAINEGKVYRFFTKPCDATELQLTIQEALENRASSQQTQRLLEATAQQLKTLEDAKSQLEQQTSDIHNRYEQLEHACAEGNCSSQSDGELLADMSHEIRTPLTAILGYADLLIEETWGPDSIESLNIIRRSGDYLLALLDDILDMSKIDAGKLTTEQIECSPKNILSDVTALMQSRADEKGISLDVEYVGPIPSAIQTDPTRFQQILLNLIGNALKFVESGGVRVVVQLQGSDHEKRPTLKIDVIDTGIGMTAEQQSHLFQPYTQVDKSITRKFGGTGLGLAISKNLAKMLGGDIQVTSSPGKGSTFTLEIETGALEEVPMHDGPFVTEQDDEENIHTPGNAKFTGRILLADDSPDTQRLISFWLMKAGAEVLVVEDGQAAVDEAFNACAYSRPYDVIMMDMNMPVLDGYKATTKLRDAAYKGAIVALTAHAMTTDKEKCLAAGCDDYLSKPIDKQKLLTTVEEYLSKDAKELSVS